MMAANIDIYLHSVDADALRNDVRGALTGASTPVPHGVCNGVAESFGADE